MKKFLLLDQDGVLVDTEFWCYQAVGRQRAVRDTYYRHCLRTEATEIPGVVQAQDISRATYRLARLAELTDLVVASS